MLLKSGRLATQPSPTDLKYGYIAKLFLRVIRLAMGYFSAMKIDVLFLYSIFLLSRLLSTSIPLFVNVHFPIHLNKSATFF